MATSLSDMLRAQRKATERAIGQRQAELRRFAAKAEAAGRRVYERAVRTGEEVLARTPAELRAVGIAAIQGRLPQGVAETVVREVVRRAPATPPRPAPKAPVSTLRQPASARAKAQPSPALAEQLRAGVSGFVDEGSFGLADHVLAASNALGEAVRDGSVVELGKDYGASMALKRKADAYDAEHYGAARNTGRVAGVAGTIAVMGAPGLTRALLAAAPRMRGAEQAVRLGLRYGPDPRGLTRMYLYGGAGAGVADQALTDVFTGDRSTPLETGAAAAGGAMGGVVTRFAGPSIGAAGGAATSALNDLANYRPISVGEAIRAGHLSGMLGKLGGDAGTRWMKNSSSQGKGAVGEFFTDVKAVARGDRIIDRQVSIPVRSAGRARSTRVDTVSERGGERYLNEAKMGPQATLSDRQIEAFNQFGDRYVVDHWRFEDVGKAAGAAASPIGAYLAEYPDPYRW